MLRKLLVSFYPRCQRTFVARLTYSAANETALKTQEDPFALTNESVPKEPSVVEPSEEDVSHVAPYLKPAFNFAAYVNKSETLQQLVKMGVDLYKIEKRPELVPFVLGLDFEKDVKAYVTFFHDLGLSVDDIAQIFTKNPGILKEGLDNLEVRVNYLRFKKFDKDMILRILQVNSYWLNYSTQQIDQFLGYFQKTFDLTGNEVRALATKSPKLITSDVRVVKLNTFVITQEIGLSSEETKSVLLDCPSVFRKNQHFVLKTFEYLHKTMGIPIEMIVKVPQILTCREFRLRQRHQFLEKLGKCQFDPKKPNYISVLTMVSGPDSHFATEIAGSSVQAFNAFLKSM